MGTPALPSKNMLVADDAHAIEAAYQARLEKLPSSDPNTLKISPTFLG
jgi:hypothetical protein